MTTPKVQKHIDRLAQALRQACSEHGRPNAFSCGFLQSEYAGSMSLIMMGIIGTNDDHLFALWQALGGRAGFGSCPTYGEGRFYV